MIESLSPKSITTETRYDTIKYIFTKGYFLANELPEFHQDSIGIIEALLHRIPLPAIYCQLQYRYPGEYHYKQVTCTKLLAIIKGFINGKLPYEGIGYPELIGKTWNSIPRNLQRRIEETNINIIILEVAGVKGSEDTSEILDYFSNKVSNYTEN